MHKIKIYLILLLVVNIKCELSETHLYTLLSKSSPHKQLFMYDTYTRFFDIDNKPLESKTPKIGYRLQIMVGNRGKYKHKDVKIKFIDHNKYLCWKQLSIPDGVILCDDDDSAYIKWTMKKTDENYEFKITNGENCLTLANADDEKIKNSFYAKTEKCENERTLEQRFLAHLLIIPDNNENHMDAESDPKKELDNNQKVNENNPFGDSNNRTGQQDSDNQKDFVPKTVGKTPQNSTTNNLFEKLLRKFEELSVNPDKRYKDGRCPLPR